MRPSKISGKRLFEDLTEVFRRKGYDGATYEDLMSATGLVKASLYHRFPQGKDDMVNSVLSSVDDQFVRYVLQPAHQEGNPKERARQIARRLREFYNSGKSWCLLDTLTLNESPKVREHARKSMAYWVESFAHLGRDAGLAPGLARKRAEDAIAGIEGGLVVSRVSGNQRPFLRTLSALPKQLTGKK